jgi:hypothetical protein
MLQEEKIEVAKGIFYRVPDSTAERPIETLFEFLPKGEQYWRRQTDFPEFFFDYNPHLTDKGLCRINATRTEYRYGKLATLSVEDTIELDRLVKRETDRMRYGVYVMNNGVRIYFPGVYYGALQWGKMFGVSTNQGYGDHRRYQREFACARQLCIEQDLLDGYYLHKIKKSGLTQLIALFLVIESITYKQFTAAIMSKNHETAKKANYKYFLYAFKNLPHVLRPFLEQKGWANSVQKLEVKSSDPAMNYENTIAAVPTTSDGLDGLPPIKRIHIDEPPKIAEIEEVYTKSKEQTRIQQEKQGIIEMSSYPPETDTKAFFWCKEFFKQCVRLDENGWPVNRMLGLYIGVAESTKGTFDVYGEPNKLLALQMEQAKRDECKTPYDLQARKRQYHATAKEGWESGGGGTVYNNIALGEQETILEEQYNFAQLNYVEGNLEWTAGRFSPVRFVPLTHEERMKGVTGRWKIYCTVEYMERNTNLCFKMPRKVKFIRKEKVLLLQPPDDVFHVGGVDPVDYAYISEMSGKQSQNASVIKDIQGNLLSVFHDRSEDPDDDLECFIMEMIFWGTRSVVEGNRKNAVTTLENQGMYYFMLVRHPNGEIVPYGQAMSIKHVSSGKDLKALYISLVMKKIKNNIGQFKNIDVIKQHKEFDPVNSQDYDLAVADGLSEVALDAVQTWVLSKKNRANRDAEIGLAMQRIMGAEIAMN